MSSNGVEQDKIIVDEYIQMGQTLTGNGNYLQAVEKFDKALKIDPLNEIAYMSKGIALASAESYDEAKTCFTRASMINKSLPDAYFQLGNIAFLTEQFEEGIKLYNRAIGLGYKSADMYYNLALVYEEKNDVEMAIRYYGKAHQIESENPIYLIRKATLQISINKCNEALQTLEILREVSPESFDGYHLSAAAYIMLERYDDAIEILDYAIELFPEDKDLILDKMRVLVTKGDVDQAQRIISMAYENEDCTDEDKKELLLNEGQIWGMKEQFDKAEECFKEALSIEVDKDSNPEIIYLLGSIYMLQKRFDDLLEISKKADRSDTKNTFNLFAPYFEGFALKQLNNPDYKKILQNAAKYYRTITMEDPSRVDCYIFRAMCYREIDNFDKAIESIEYVSLLQPDNGRLYFIKATILQAAGKPEEAKAAYLQAQSLGYNAGDFNSIWG